MTGKDNQPDQAADLRQRAETAFREKAAQSPDDIGYLSPEAARRLLHDLQVHQIELEMQNEELRRAQEELEAARARYFDLYDLAPVGYVTVSAKGLILDANLAAAKLLDVARGGLVREPLSRFILKDDQDIYYRHHRQLMKTGVPQTFELRLVRKDGTAFWAHLETTSTQEPAVGKEQEAGGTFECRIVLSDINERVRLAEEKARLEDQLRQSQKMEAIGRLAGGVAHDFNNITAIVLGYAEMLLGRLGPADPSRKHVEQILAAGRRSAVLTRQLLAFGRRQTLLPEVLDLNALLRNLDTMLRRVIGEDVRLELKLAAQLGRVTADPGQLEQVVTNLVVNARDAMPGGGRLTLETADVELDELSAPGREGVVPGRYVRLAITDTGCGLDKAALSRLFEPFYTTKERGKGTGLGLATAYGIVKQFGGYIWASSEPGVGTTFRIYLPWTDAQPRAKAPEAAGAALRGVGELILLVEDEAPLREMCATILSNLGYRVSAAANGPEALRLVQEQGIAPDLFLTDVIMPGMSGAQLAQRLGKDRPGLKVLYMSGYPDEAIAPHGILEPGTHFIQKPFTEGSLAAKVREVLEKQGLAEKAGAGARTVPAEQSAARRAAGATGRRVLMIDDDGQFRELVQHFCTKRGHVFTGVDSAAAALAALAGSAFDVLLVDLNIPGTSGERVLREIRAAGHAAPAIVLTGDPASADLDALRPLGAGRVLEKSSNAGPLLRAIEAATAGEDRAS
ncbi:MAG: hybrid sensor histidine kinase/response regulator [Candidatus Methylomirabilia bacterium]